VKCEYFNAKLISNAILSPAAATELPPFEKDRHRSLKDKDGQEHAHVMLVLSKAMVHNSTVIRRKTAARIREALQLISYRGAKGEGNEIVLERPEGAPLDSGNPWLMSGK
jgi:hypothetical protein